MNLDELQDGCKKNLLNKNNELNKNKLKLNQKGLKTHHPEIINSINKHTSFLDDKYNNIPIHQRLYHLIYNINRLQLCCCCNETSVRFRKFNEGYNKYCCVNCRKIGVQKQIKETCQLKYGVDNIFKSDEFKEKSKKTCIKKYGVDNIFKSDEFKYDKEINDKRLKSQKNTIINRTEEEKNIISESHREVGNNFSEEKIQSIINNRKNTGNKRTEEQTKNSSEKRKTTGRNKSDDEIQNIINKITTTKKKNGSYTGVSKTSQIFFWRLYDRLSNNLQKEKCYFHELNSEYKIYNYSVDFIVNNKIIEFYGDEGHANPNKYNKNDVPKVFSEKKSIDIGEHDNKRNNIILDEGYEILVIGASEVVSNEEKVINKCKYFINNI